MSSQHHQKKKAPTGTTPDPTQQQSSFLHQQDAHNSPPSMGGGAGQPVALQCAFPAVHPQGGWLPPQQYHAMVPSALPTPSQQQIGGGGWPSMAPQQVAMIAAHSYSQQQPQFVFAQPSNSFSSVSMTTMTSVGDPSMANHTPSYSGGAAGTLSFASESMAMEQQKETSSIHQQQPWSGGAPVHQQQGAIQMGDPQQFYAVPSPGVVLSSPTNTQPPSPPSYEIDPGVTTETLKALPKRVRKKGTVVHVVPTPTTNDEDSALPQLGSMWDTDSSSWKMPSILGSGTEFSLSEEPPTNPQCVASCDSSSTSASISQQQPPAHFQLHPIAGGSPSVLGSPQVMSRSGDAVPLCVVNQLVPPEEEIIVQVGGGGSPIAKA